LVDARDTACVWLAPAALWAHTESDRSRRFRSDHATKPSALRLPAALAYSDASSSFHAVLLLPVIVHPSEAISATATATRHCEGIAVEVATEPCLHHFVQFAGHEGDYPDALIGHQNVQRPRNRPADERANAEFCQAQHPI
jgi:hypothetical protein